MGKYLYADKPLVILRPKQRKDAGIGKVGTYPAS
jgi:hypothetical protein